MSPHWIVSICAVIIGAFTAEAIEEASRGKPSVRDWDWKSIGFVFVIGPCSVLGLALMIVWHVRGNF